MLRLLLLLLYFAFSIYPSSTTSSNDNIKVAEQLKEMRLELNQLNHKSRLSELKNVRQDGEIRFLKTVLIKIISGQQNNDEIISAAMNKRPARILPLRLLLSKGEKEMPIIGPPSSCKDLNELGHTLNGIYLIMANRTSSTNSKIVQSVFCDFQPVIIGAQKTSSPSPVLESRLGYVDVKSSESGIYFYVQISNRTTAPFPLTNPGVLRYDHEVSNIGGGMNLKTGVFTAPKAGVYTFSFSISKTGYEFSFMDINLRVNGVRIGKAGAGVGLSGNTAAMQSTLKLKVGDRVDLLKSRGDLNRECNAHCHHFTGSLMEEDLPAIVY